MNEWLRYLIAFVVACHGLTYFLFGILGPRELKDWNGTSRVLGHVLTPQRVRAAVPVVHGVAGATIIAAGIAIVLAPLVKWLWPPVAILGAIASIGAFASFWDGRPKYIVQEGGIGLGLSVILLMFALLFPRIFS